MQYSDDTSQTLQSAVLEGLRVPTLALPDLDMYYAEAGHGPPLLLIHGTQPDADVWGPTFPQSAHEHRVIAYDRRGFSRSTHAPATDYRTHAADAAAMLEGLGAAPAGVLGWSWGGIVALELAAHRPELVANLVLVEPALHLKKHPTPGVVWAVLQTHLARRLHGDVAAAETFLNWACRRTTGGSALQRYPATPRETIRRNSPAIVAEVGAGTGEALTEARIASISCPVTVVVGELSDAAFGQAAQRVARLLPQCHIVRISQAGHAVHFDQPEAFVHAVEQAQRDAHSTAAGTQCWHA
jgi:3-oxoadipate enol-lactonase